MKHAKVNGASLVKFPYSYSDLREENHFTHYDSRYDLTEWYAKTEHAAKTGARIVDVVTADQPACDYATHYLERKTTPELINDVWTLGWDIVERPPAPESETIADE